MTGFRPRSGWLLVITVSLAALLSLAACSPGSTGWMDDHHDAMHGGGDTSDSAPVSASGTAEVTIQNYAFTPGNLRVTAGTTVTPSPIRRPRTARNGRPICCAKGSRPRSRSTNQAFTNTTASHIRTCGRASKSCRDLRWLDRGDGEMTFGPRGTRGRS